MRAPQRQATISERITSRLKEFRLNASTGPPQQPAKPEVHFDADEEEKQGAPKIDKGKGRASDVGSGVTTPQRVASPPPLDPPMPPAKVAPPKLETDPVPPPPPPQGTELHVVEYLVMEQRGWMPNRPWTVSASVQPGSHVGSHQLAEQAGTLKMFEVRFIQSSVY